MTFNISQPAFICENCSVAFVPFKKDFKCPNCGEPTEEYFDLIPELIGSMKAHKAEYGRFRPDSWYTGHLTEHIQSLIFQIFDGLEHDKPEDGEKFIIDCLEKSIDWGDQQYLKNHTKDIALAVYEIYKNEPALFRIKRNFDLSEIFGIKRMLYRFLDRHFLP